MLHPAFVLAESLTRGTSWRLAGSLLRVLRTCISMYGRIGEGRVATDAYPPIQRLFVRKSRIRIAARFKLLAQRSEMDRTLFRQVWHPHLFHEAHKSKGRSLSTRQGD